MCNNLRLIALSLLLIASCSDAEYKVREPAPNDDTIDITAVSVALPVAEGKALVERSCVPCHSLRYIEMQPAMSKTAWEHIVSKMIKVYGAPVHDSVDASAIIDYLVSIRGSGALPRQ